MTSRVVCIVLCIFFAICGRGQSDEVCIPVRKDTESPTPTPQTTGVQGRPGKIGPAGAPGVQGLPGLMGPSGTCTCDPQDVEELREQVQALRNEVANVKSVSFSDDAKIASCSVGIKDGRVRDSQLTASSIWNDSYIGANGRLDNLRSLTTKDGGCWGPREQRAGEWLQVDLLEPTRIAGVVTQGWSVKNQWITNYKIQYGNSVSTLITIKNGSGNDKVFQGNTDRNTHVIRAFPRPLVARYFRLVVQTFHHYIALRMDFVTC